MSKKIKGNMPHTKEEEEWLDHEGRPINEKLFIDMVLSLMGKGKHLDKAAFQKCKSFPPRLMDADTSTSKKPEAEEEYSKLISPHHPVPWPRCKQADVNDNVLETLYSTLTTSQQSLLHTT
ncbi:hypothetical protein KEM48_004049 [Puccinia striiformis f. sp. tritici PST-130]|nr:hypothetical protein KEM48_004049 [Puccinia striiformis f. sp. tritici PST-130]